MARARPGVLFDSVRGRLDQVVVVQTRTGLGVRRRPVFRKVLTPAQQAGRDRLRVAAALWHELEPAEVDAWRDYAAQVRRRQSTTLVEYSPIAYNAFTMLTTKWLQLNGGGDPPRTPPMDDFIFEQPKLTVEAVEGGVRFTADSPTGPGEVAELMLQPLANVNRRPGNQYVAAAFTPFPPGQPTYDLPLPPGAYAFASRYARVATGEQAGLGVVGKVELQGT
ncbi:MAG: hypothetical protein KIT11_05835 [Fimbriimonadaceae bacterium]|nr:hypothetical protein [Fimbriimonadaceae bacterium]QYK55881.1 MAG: hypothetical protein KF733_00025 [Fimbriimonadaceae bacterium]